MSVNFKNLCVLVALPTMLAACGNSYEAQIQKSLDVNQTAATLEEWLESNEHSDKVFADLRKEFYLVDKTNGTSSVGQEVCTELNKLEVTDLTQFETNIQDTENELMLASCKTDLLTKLDGYYKVHKKALVENNWSASGASFKFPDVVQKRDFSKGYFAVTGDLGRKEVVITFDDGPASAYTGEILDALKAVNAKAIFFPLAKAVKANPKMVKRIAAEGHVVGSHTVNHKCIGTQNQCRKSNGGKFLSYEQGVAEIAGGHNAVHDVLGYADPFFRFPYGGSSPALKQYLAKNGIGEFFWNIDSNDWRTQTPAQLVQSTISQVERQGRGILLFHDIQRRTAAALPSILKQLYHRGYTIVLLQAMDQNAKYKRLGATK